MKLRQLKPIIKCDVTVCVQGHYTYVGRDKLIESSYHGPLGLAPDRLLDSKVINMFVAFLWNDLTIVVERNWSNEKTI